MINQENDKEQAVRQENDMSQHMASASAVPPTPSSSWSAIWLNALLHPSIPTYQSIAKDPQANGNRAFSWIVTAAIVAGVIEGLAQYGPDLGAICLGPMFAALFALLLFAFVSALSVFVARVLGGTGSRAQFDFVMAAFTAPILLIGAVLGAIPFLAWLGIPLLLYWYVLHTFAIKATHGLSWRRAALPTIVLFGLNAAFVVLAFAVPLVLQLQQRLQ